MKMSAPTNKPITPELDHVEVDRRSVLAFQHGFPSPLIRWHCHDDYELLSNSEEPVTSICHEVGFHNVANFNRHFKDYKSMTPREYRKQVKAR